MSRKQGKKRITNYSYENVLSDDISKVTQLSLFDEEIRNAECYKHDFVFKKIDSGNQREIECFPGIYASREFVKNMDNGRVKDEKKIKENNTRKKYKKFERSVHHNYKLGDWFLTLTFNDLYQTTTKEETIKALKQFLDSINKKRKRRDLPAVKYIYVAEKGLRKGRWHIHLFMDTLLPIEEIRKSWGKRGFLEADPLAYRNQDGKENFVGLCRYLAKHKEDYPELYKKEAWDFITGHSQNLIKPEEKEYKTPIPKKAIKQMAVKDKADQLEAARQTFEKKYKDYEVTDVQVKVNPHYEGLYYISVRMQKRSGSNDKNKRVRI